MGQQFTDGARAKLAAALAGTDTSLSIDAGGDLFPVASAGDLSAVADMESMADPWFKLVLQDDAGIEIVYVGTHASASTDFSNVLRGQEGTTARAFSTGATVGLRFTAADAASIVTLAGVVSGLNFDSEYYPRADADASMALAASKVSRVQSVAAGGGVYTLTAADAGGLVVMNDTAANSVGVPPTADVAFPVGTVVYVMQAGTGQTSASAGVGVTLLTPTGLNVPGQNQMLGLIKTASDTWSVVGAAA